MLPTGQKARHDFPRFGLPAYAGRFPKELVDRSVKVEVEGHGAVTIDVASADLPRSSIRADFHCVTTWSYEGAHWEGVRFADFYRAHVQPLEDSGKPFTGAVLFAQDGYKTTLLLEDLLDESVMLADTLDGQRLSIEHGAPLRLVAPAHYGYKNLKHLARIAFYADLPVVKRGVRAFLDHPRARVRKEERGRWVPGWMLRFLFRPLIGGTVKDFRRAMDEYGDEDRPSTLA